MRTLGIHYQPWGETLGELVDAARRAERAGASAIWVSELHRSATITAAAVATATEEARVGTGIQLGFARSSMATALESLDLQELAQGRFILGLGSGVRRLVEQWHGSEFDEPVERLGEVLTNVRSFWRDCTLGQVIAPGSTRARMRIEGYERPFPIAHDDPPIYVAAVGPRMARLAGREADGWLSHELCSPEFVTDHMRPILEVGLRDSGRSRNDLEMVASLVCSVATDGRVARERLVGHVGFYASVRAFSPFFAFHGLESEHKSVVAQFRAGRPAASLEMRPELTELVAAAGEPEAVMSRLAAFEGVADAVKLSPPVHGLSAPEIREAQNHLIHLIASIVGGAP